MREKKEILADKHLVRGPSPIKIKPLENKMYNMFEVASLVAKAGAEAEQRTMRDLTARFLDGSAYALMKKFELLQDPETRLAVYCEICRCVNKLEKTPKSIIESRLELFKQTNIIIEDGELSGKCYK